MFHAFHAVWYTSPAMCGRYGFSARDAREVATRFDAVNLLPDYQPRFNIAPGQMNPVVTRHSPNQLERMFWGLIPSFAKDDKAKYRTINARAEGIESKPTYRKPFRFQPCLVPATGFYEWDKKRKPSQPYYFQLKDESIFAFAGLYDVWRDPRDGADVRSYTIITTQANDLVGRIHPRMPVILRREDEEEWLNPDITDPERLLPLLVPYPENAMQAMRVSPAVNTPTRDDATLIQPFNSFT